MAPFRILFVLGVLAGLLGACADLGMKKDAPLTWKPVSFAALEGWAAGDHARALAAFRRSCEPVLAQDPAKPLGGDAALYGTAGDWQPACNAAAEADPATARAFFEDLFAPVALRAGRKAEGLFTGYFEPELKGARARAAGFETPLLARPGDLVTVDLGAFREDLKGKRIAGRVRGGRLEPFETRAEIEAAPEAVADPLVWVSDPVDAFFLHIQGSGRVVLEDGAVMRVGYAAQNGHPYTAVGRVLIEEGALTRETVSMQTIRAWLAANPGQAAGLMNENRSFIFFSELDIADPDLGPLGAQGVPLTPEASLAVDRAHHALGVPMWLQGEAPTGVAGAAEPIRGLFIAQDTGGAIRGPVRGDVFWGFGPRAAEIAGLMKHEGRLFALLPKPLAARTASR